MRLRGRILATLGALSVMLLHASPAGTAWQEDDVTGE
jgi:hypothetical protein